MYIFLFSPNNSGTTVICQYLAGQFGAYLPPFGNFEGQMVPTVKKHMAHRAWSSATKLDWDFIKAEWDKLLEESGKPYFIEGSPPNLMRIPAIRSHFGDSAKYLISLSNPYAYLGSSCYNYSKSKITEKTLKIRTNKWIEKAYELRKSIQLFPEIPVTSYERFCGDPKHLMGLLDAPYKPGVVIQGKANDPVNEIIDMSPRNIAFFNENELDCITAALRPHEALLESFGYKLELGSTIIDKARTHEKLFKKGRKRRLAKDAHLNTIKSRLKSAVNMHLKRDPL